MGRGEDMSGTREREYFQRANVTKQQQRVNPKIGDSDAFTSKEYSVRPNTLGQGMCQVREKRIAFGD